MGSKAVNNISSGFNVLLTRPLALHHRPAVVKEGMMSKSAGASKHKHWDRRYFVLTQTSLTYRKKKNSKSARGVIPLDVVSEVRMARSDHAQSKLAYGPFEVVTEYALFSPVPSDFSALFCFLLSDLVI